MNEKPLLIADFSSREALLKYIAESIDELHESLESPHVDQRVADYHRGHIAALKQIKSAITN